MSRHDHAIEGVSPYIGHEFHVDHREVREGVEEHHQEALPFHRQPGGSAGGDPAGGRARQAGGASDSALGGRDDLLDHNVAALDLDHRSHPPCAGRVPGRLEHLASTGLNVDAHGSALNRVGRPRHHQDVGTPGFRRAVEHLDREFGHSAGTAAAGTEPGDDPSPGDGQHGDFRSGTLVGGAVLQVDENSGREQAGHNGDGQDPYQPHQSRSIRRRSHPRNSTIGATAPISWPERRHQGDE